MRSITEIKELKSFCNQALSFLSYAAKTTEVRATFVLSALGLITLLIEPKVLQSNFMAISEFRAQSIKETVEEYLDETTTEISVIEQLNLNDIKEQSDTYSFEHTSLGFNIKDLKFLESDTREMAQKRILELLPNNLKAKARKYIQAVLKISEVHQVDPLWVISVMWTESHFQPRAKSHVGAHGLMQLMPITRKYLYKKYRKKGHSLIVEKENFNIQDYFSTTIPHKDFNKNIMKLVNIELGVIYLKKLLKRFNYNHKFATVAYNMGPSWTRRRLQQNLAVGDNNNYLNKVTKAYQYLVKRI